MPSYEGNEGVPPKHIDTGQFKCICCGLRYWKKNKLIRRAAQCKGARYNSESGRWRCKAWRCRFNDQCSEANAACPICGAFKPPEFQSLQPASAPDPASSVQPAPRPVAACEPASTSSSSSSTIRPTIHQSSQFGPVVEHVTGSVIQDNAPGGIVTLLPLLEGMTQRYLTEV